MAEEGAAKGGGRGRGGGGGRGGGRGKVKCLGDTPRPNVEPVANEGEFASSDSDQEPAPSVKKSASKRSGGRLEGPGGKVLRQLIGDVKTTIITSVHLSQPMPLPLPMPMPIPVC